MKRLKNLSFAWLITLASLVLANTPADGSELSVADRAVVAKYRAARIDRDMYIARSTIKNSDRQIKGAPARLKREQPAVDKAKAAFQAAEKVLAQRENELEAATAKANDSDEATTKAAVAEATKKRDQAKQELNRKSYALKRAEARLENVQKSIDKAKSDKAKAEESIPKLEVALKEATAVYEGLRKQSVAAELKHAGTQKPQTVSDAVDRLIDERLKKENVPASALVEDGKFLRRATLDIAGRIPTYQEVVEFLKSDAEDKRAKAVDRLLTTADYGRTFGTIFADLTTHRPTTTATRTRDHFRGWLIECLNLNRTWDDIVSDMIAGEGDTGSNPGTIFLVAYRLNNQPNPPDILAASGEMFMGLQIKCAQCHDHPFVDDWSQDDFWGMAAMFSRVRLKGSSVYRALEYELTDNDVEEKELFRVGGGVKYPAPLPNGQIAIPDPTDETKTIKTVSAQYLDGFKPELQEKGFYRRDFANWLTSPENPYFARAMVNRLWGHFFARGLVQPVASMNPENDGTHPEVLSLLEKEFRESGFDLKHLIRCIVRSRTYQRSSRPTDENIEDKTLYSHMAVKTLEADALLDSLTIAIGRPLMSDNRRQSYKDLFDTRLPDVDPGKFTHNIPQVLRMMNAREYNDASTVIAAATNDKPTEAAIENLYLAALARKPTGEETKTMKSFVDESTNTREAYSDVYWVLINSAEFLVNH
ncbi:MAG: hypothetical protein CMJ78_14495 [Planctomycetaceae bacterium]|nr:hypothetical protein [Planctomycetaceae bacterium]